MNPRKTYPRQVMGIVNCTPDSFYTGKGRMPSRDELRSTIEEQLRAGVDLLDFGGYSTRPGADEITPEEEWQRVEMGLQVAEEVCRELDVWPVWSVDTFREEVARRAVERYRVGMINDVTGGQYEEAMYRLVAETGVKYVAMHMRGTPKTMQQLTAYRDVVGEVRAWLAERVERMLAVGVQSEQIVLDPGFGFAKEREQEYQLLAALEELTVPGYPLLVGISRKSMVIVPLGIKKDAALPATTALHWELLRRGASILRVHDVAAARQVVDLYNYYEKTALQR